MKMPRKPYPYEELVQEIRELLTSQVFFGISDDADMYAVRMGDESPMNAQVSSNVSKQRQAENLGLELVEIGEPAAEAVALGLRMQGRWRQELLPFAKEHRGVPVIRAALELVAVRERDPLAWRAEQLLKQSRGGKEKG
jgi:hypothetical protein